MEKPLIIYPQKCKQQQQDLEHILTAADELGAAALALHTSGSMGYAGFIYAREELKKVVTNVVEHYRFVE